MAAAKTCFMTALTLNPHHAKSLLMLGRLHRKGHDLYDDDLAQVLPPPCLSLPPSLSRQAIRLPQPNHPARHGMTT